jgi:hypothetical protein
MRPGYLSLLPSLRSKRHHLLFSRIFDCTLNTTGDRTESGTDCSAGARPHAELKSCHHTSARARSSSLRCTGELLVWPVIGRAASAKSDNEAANN